ncbi:RsmD family RNA methyltransferase [Mesonia sp. HuA40]|uniref:RsmD family RNA methyltransferase n=1 Tax=Mesonia sp. HuA40 TaxID=2602761 RepID=UPI0011CB1BCE|nr:RsmD family RNA methyltransferase [Mesonia sp. HuA40]TXK71089.1 methyltransferase [Mesonia sp. HuA40]
MRIISGKFKSKRIIAPKKLPIRPTTDIAKEGLFNILNNTYNFTELIVLDLFAGSGNICYEFASRGCTEITAVDKHYNCIKFINETSASLGIQINTIKKDVYTYLKIANQTFDLIFADPPYDFTTDQFEELVQLVFNQQHLKDEGILIIEHPKTTPLSSLANFIDERRYGGSVFSFFKK